MLNSMTAYGRAHLQTKFGRLTTEIQSVNRKHFDITVNMPREMSRFDANVRKWVSEAISRGQVTVKISVHYDETFPLALRANLPMARQLKAAWETIAQELGVKKEITLQLLANESGLIVAEEEIQDEELYRSALENAVRMALEEFLAMRKREGMALFHDIKERIALLKLKIEVIAARVDGASDRYRQKLLDRLREILPGVVENEERILREIALFAERIDVTEEVIRFRSHCGQAEEMLFKEGPIGKSFEFLLQELSREINTIGSKSADVDISQIVVEIKTELERIREQIQNVE